MTGGGASSNSNNRNGSKSMVSSKAAAAFVKAQQGFGAALKTNTNPAFKTKYADLSACIEAVIDALHASGLALMQPTHLTDTGVTVETVFVHESGETLSGGVLHVPASKQDPQGYGSALTYARRYSLMAACGIAPEDDDGHAASAKPTVLGVSRKADLITTMKEARDLESLKAAFDTAIRAARAVGDTAAEAEFRKAKDAAKDALMVSA